MENIGISYNGECEKTIKNVRMRDNGECWPTIENVGMRDYWKDLNELQ